MRIQLSLRCRPGSRIPLNYQYEFSSWIYHTLAQASPEFAAWLHEHGYNLEGAKRFKFFTFSRLHLHAPFEIDAKNQAMLLQSGRADLTLSFLLNDTLQHFVAGLFRQQRFGIGNARFRPVDFEVQSVEILPPPVFQSAMRFRALSPICVSASEEGNPHPQYRSPEAPDYADLLFANLRQKLLTADHYAPAGSLRSPAPDGIPEFRLLSKPKQNGITLKAHTPQETKVIGYAFDFEINGPAELMEIGYYAGFGVENAQGFGCVGVVGEW